MTVLGTDKEIVRQRNMKIRQLWTQIEPSKEENTRINEICTQWKANTAAFLRARIWVFLRAQSCCSVAVLTFTRGFATQDGGSWKLWWENHAPSIAPLITGLGLHKVHSVDWYVEKKFSHGANLVNFGGPSHFCPQDLSPTGSNLDP